MRHQARSARRLALGAFVGLANVGLGCNSGNSSVFLLDGSGGGHRDGSFIGDGGAGSEGGTVKKLGGQDANTSCVHSTCAELNADCGEVTDKKCGGVVNCGSCQSGMGCGGGGVPNRCGNKTVKGDGGASGDSCQKLTCAAQAFTCGVGSDGCGGTLDCGSCNVPQTCGGDPAKPGQCGCTGVCSGVVACSGTTTTDLAGTVYDPAGQNPLYNVLVYVPNDPSDSGLLPFPAGISCDLCGAEAAGSPLVTTFTAADGTFTLKGVPVGESVPVVIQLGRWRRQFTIPIPNACTTNTVSGTQLSMPQNHMQGDLPRIAILTGGYDPVECALVDFGVDQSEFTNPGGGGYINFYSSTVETPGSGPPFSGATISDNQPQQDQGALFATTGAGDGGTQPMINNYDMVILECQGGPTTQLQAQEAQLATYLAAGGRVFGSDFIYDWFADNPALQGAADWDGNNCGYAYQVTGTIDPTNPTGTAFQDWLQVVGISAAGSDTVELAPAYPNVASVISPTQQWLYSGVSEYTPGLDCTENPDVPAPVPIQFTFNTPLGAPPAQQCGRVTFNDWHAFVSPPGTPGYPNFLSNGTTFPAACMNPGGGSSPQEKILEFMLFDLSACVQPYTPICTPRKCATAGIGGTAVECGPAGDGCGGVLQCGGCQAGQTCGGGGASKCGVSTTTSCTSLTCAAQGIQCGPAGDGCGNEIQCGPCPTGEICGFSSPGICGGQGPA